MKVNRAKGKLITIEQLISDYLASKPYTTRRKFDGKRAYLLGRVVKLPPDDLAMEVVEAVSHLRGALDKIIVELVTKNGRGTSGVGFPFGSQGPDGRALPFPDRRIVQKVANKLTPEQWQFILDQKPYPGGDDILWSINQVANADKHWRGLVEVHSDTFNHILLDGIGTRAYMGDTLPEHQGITDFDAEEVIVSVDTDNPSAHVMVTVSPLVSFGKIAPLERKNIVLTLKGQIDVVSRILRECETGFFV